MDQGREVFAVPGNITSKMSWGPNLLIKEGGAKLVQEWSDVTNELPAAVRRELVSKAQQKMLLDGCEPLPECPQTGTPKSPKRHSVANFSMPCKLMNLNNLMRLLESFEGVSSSELISALFELEMNGLVRQLPGKKFVKVW